MYAKGKGIHVKQKNVKNAKGTKKVIFEYRHDLKDELDCDKGYVDDVKCNDRKDNKNQCTDDDASYKDDDTSSKDVSSCKDDNTSYRDDGSCNNNSTSWRNDMMKAPCGPDAKSTTMIVVLETWLVLMKLLTYVVLMTMKMTRSNNIKNTRLDQLMLTRPMHHPLIFNKTFYFILCSYRTYLISTTTV